jgi:hypothetical protein
MFSYPENICSTLCLSLDLWLYTNILYIPVYIPGLGFSHTALISMYCTHHKDCNRKWERSCYTAVPTSGSAVCYTAVPGEKPLYDDEPRSAKEVDAQQSEKPF